MKHRLLSLCLIGALCVPALHAADRNRTTSSEVEKYLQIFASVLRDVDMWYVDSLDYQKMVEAGINAMLAETDRYTVYYSENEQDMVRRFMTGKYGGIGSVVQQRDSMVQISAPQLGMPAQRNDVRAGDYIISVNGENCVGKTTKEVSELLRGKPGTPLTLVLDRDGEKVTKHFLREEIQQPFVRHIAMLNDSVGYIAFDEFSEHSAQEFRRAMSDLTAQGMKQVIIDIRDNGGGMLSECLDIYSLFVPRGTEMASLRGKVPSTHHNYRTATTPLYPDMPVYILVDENSASASEVLCGAMQDMQRATLIGCKTFGKGVVQNIHHLDHNDQLKVTVSRYYLPSGRCIHGVGVTPDVVVEEDTTRQINIAYDLYHRHYIFDYATRYRRLHDSIPAMDTRIPCTRPILDSLDIVAFEQYLVEREYTYQTSTGEYMDELIRGAQHEDIAPEVLEQLQALRASIGGDYHDALWRNKKDVLRLLESEIAERYYYAEASTIVYLRYDDVLNKALELAAGEGK